MEYPDPTLLVVDDTEDNLDLLEFALKRKPIKMLRASSGRQCLEIAQEQNPDVILLDIQMPEMDGFETLMHLRANPVTAKIPVIFLTAQRKDASSIEQGLELGADEYLTKPIDTEELLVRSKMLVRVKRAESELERTKADFMAMLVHDLRSPLNGIKSVIDFYRELRDQGKQFSAEQLGLLDTAGDSARRMLELINDILDLSKFEAGNMALDKQKIALPIVLDTVARETELQFKQKGITVVKDYAKDLPDVVIDAEKVAQVVMNLLSNALKFTKAGGSVTITTSLESDAAPGSTEQKKFIKVGVTDTGVGIPAEEIPQLFERYKQVSSAKRIKQKGTGLGLSICKMIIQSHGGKMGVESELGKHTTFHFTLPTE
ncbi:MAG TPA: hybrid sensor histidine kinase/response regulator [Bacteroidota bacterium]|nr:hybrid sensor histidine kinase/response regulator [Bacteroidota bacterium]